MSVQETNRSQRQRRAVWAAALLVTFFASLLVASAAFATGQSSLEALTKKLGAPSPEGPVAGSVLQPGAPLGLSHDAGQPQSERIPGHYIVVLKDSVAHPAAVAEAQTESHDGELGLLYRYAIKGYSAELSKSAVEALRQNPKVKSVSPDYHVETFSQTIPTGIQRSFDTENEVADIDGEDTRVNADVAVIDTGIDPSQPDLNLYKRVNCVPAGEDFETEYEVEECVEGSGSDGAGHGTHVAGTIGALDNDKGVVGVAPGVRLWSVRVLNNEGGGSFAWIIAGVDWVTAHASEIEVANMSLGCWCYSAPMEEAIEASIEAGVVYAVAAGNSGEEIATFTPARTPGAITVSALADSDGKPGGEGPEECFNDSWGGYQYLADDTLAKFSNYGEGVDIAAPGVCILSTLPGGEYGTESGTSMASPHVAGAAALLASKSNPNSRKDVEAIRNELVNGASLDYDNTRPAPLAPLLYMGKQPPPPEAATGGAEAVSAQSATLHGAVNARGSKAEYRFEYGTDTSYGNSVPASPGEILSGAGFTQVKEKITGLEPAREYHYRLTATTSKGAFNGHDLTFETKPIVSTTVASSITEDEATLNGALANDWSEGEAISYSFEYGLTTDYGHTVQGEVDEGEESWIYGYSEAAHVIANVTGLDKATTYHYRLVASSNQGTFYGNDQRFRTAVWSPSAVPSEPPSDILTDLSCPSAGFCMAITPSSPYTERWDGEAWETLPRPEVDSRGAQIRLVDVSCTSASFCIAVGEASGCKSTFCKSLQIALRWNGEEWAITPGFPAMPFAASAVACTSMDKCIAVGWSQKVNGDGTARTLYASVSWDGKEWTALPAMPQPPFIRSFTPELQAISCVSASDCTAVGFETMHWDGSEWSRMKMPQGAGIMHGVSCVSSSACMAVGVTWGKNGWYSESYRSSAAVWDGETWSLVPVGEIGKAGGESELLSVSCVSDSSCAAVGLAATMFWPDSLIHPAALHWDGEEWSADAVAQGHKQETWMEDVSCVSSSHCITAGLLASEETDEGTGLVEDYDYATSAPTATSHSASGVGTTRATLNGTVNGGGLLTKYYFEYGLSTAYGNKSPASSKSIGSSTADVDVNQAIKGLKANTAYHYRLVAENEAGTSKGKDMTLATTRPSATFHAATEGNVKVTAKADPSAPIQVFTTEVGEVECYAVSASATGPHSASEVALGGLSYGECEAIGQEAGVKFNGCSYVAHAGLYDGEGRSSGAVDLQCPTGKQVEIDAAGLCTIKVPAQSGLQGLYFEPGGGSPQELRAVADLTGIQYSYEGLCGKGSSKTGTYKGKVKLKAVTDDSSQKAVALSVAEG
jgi:subtilisin family serine protease